MLGAKDPQYNLGANLEYMEESADGSTSSIHDIVKSISSDVIAVGYVGALVDMPSNEGGLTRQQMSDAKFAPRIIQYKAEQIIYYRTDDRG
ncbi:MAG: hypothetical protein GY886_09785, partial [Gammaproteobacteria bacterium]|nr:hypothetical protein [Gammaproteobacteria bacterium]